jgi:hypothetical protein
MDNVINELRDKGFVTINNFVDKAVAAKIKSYLDGSQVVNSNEISYIWMNDAKYLSNALINSREVYDIITSDAVLNIAKNYLGDKFRLKCHRIYTVSKYSTFPWHTDDKYEDIKNNTNGIVFIIYLSDTFDGGTEFVATSNKFSRDYSKTNYSDKLIREKYKELTVKTSGYAGTVIISDIKTIHRGGLFRNNFNKRTSLWFQIDTCLDNAERLAINPSFLNKNMSDDLKNFLGFGLTCDLPVHPILPRKMVRNIPFSNRFQLLFQSIIGVFCIPYDYLRLNITGDIKSKIKSIFVKTEYWN